MLQVSFAYTSICDPETFSDASQSNSSYNQLMWTFYLTKDIIVQREHFQHVLWMKLEFNSWRKDMRLVASLLYW